MDFYLASTKTTLYIINVNLTIVPCCAVSMACVLFQCECSVPCAILLSIKGYPAWQCVVIFVVVVFELLRYGQMPLTHMARSSLHYTIWCQTSSNYPKLAMWHTSKVWILRSRPCKSTVTMTDMGLGSCHHCQTSYLWVENWVDMQVLGEITHHAATVNCTWLRLPLVKTATRMHQIDPTTWLSYKMLYWLNREQQSVPLIIHLPQLGRCCARTLWFE